jgi:hypothetical protein
MVTIFGRLDQSLKDMILLYEICFTSVMSKSENCKGLSDYYINKEVSAIIRHWQVLLKEVPEYGRIHNWGICHTPYYYGEVLFKRIDPGAVIQTSYFEVYYIKEIIARNDIFKNLGVKFLHQDGIDSNDKTFFPVPDPDIYGEYKRNSDIEAIDLELVRSLSSLYSRLSMEDLETLSTCPTLSSCVNAIKTEVSLWMRNINDIFKLMEPPKIQDTYIKHKVNNLFDLAYTCSTEIPKKRNWYERITEVSASMLSIAKQIGFPEKLLKPLLIKLGDGTINDEIITAVNLSRIFAGYCCFASDSLSQYGIKISKQSNPDVISAFEQELFDTIDCEVERQAIYHINLSRTSSRSIDVNKHLLSVFSKILIYCEDMGFQCEYKNFSPFSYK